MVFVSSSLGVGKFKGYVETAAQNEANQCQTPMSKALRYGTHTQETSQFYLHTPRLSANLMNHTCLCPSSRSWCSFTTPEGWKAELALKWCDMVLLKCNKRLLKNFANVAWHDCCNITACFCVCVYCRDMFYCRLVLILIWQIWFYSHYY